MDGKILQLSEVEIKKYIGEISFLQKTLLPELSKMIKTLNSVDLNNNALELKKIIQNQNKSQEFSKENSESIENLSHSIKVIQDSISNRNTESCKNRNINLDAKIGIEKSKLQLNQAIKSLNEISIVIQKNAQEISTIEPNVDISKIQSKINKTIKESIKFKELDEMLDLYSGKISYFAEKTKEYDNSIFLLTQINDKINYIIPSFTLVLGFSVGVILTLMTK